MTIERDAVTLSETANESSARAIDAPIVPAAAGSRRIVSVDVLRGLTILLMVFVNDLGPAAPRWMHHIEPPRADGMTLADVVFPMFLFIVGVSIPLAFERARAVGTSLIAQLTHIVARSAGLLLMGVIVMNTEDGSRVGPVWSVLAFIAILLAWCSVPPEPVSRRKVFLGLKAFGILGLVGLMAWYRREPHATELPFFGKVEAWSWLRTEWWGILGLIGWAYLTVAILTLILGRRREWLMGAMALLMTIHVVMQRGGLLSHLDSKSWLGVMKPVLESLRHGIETLGNYISVADATGSLAAITMAGCLLGSILTRGSDVQSHRERLSWAASFAIGLLIAGLITDSFEGINKIAATPTWCFFSAGIAISVWILLYLLIDVAGIRAWTIIISPAGANPLIAYFLHPILAESVAIIGLGGIVLGYKDSSDPSIAVAGSFGMALTVCIVTGLLARLGLRVRL